VLNEHERREVGRKARAAVLRRAQRSGRRGATARDYRARSRAGRVHRARTHGSRAGEVADRYASDIDHPTLLRAHEPEDGRPAREPQVEHLAAERRRDRRTSASHDRGDRNGATEASSSNAGARILCAPRNGDAPAPRPLLKPGIDACSIAHQEPRGPSTPTSASVAELASDLIVLCHACHRLHHQASGRPRRPRSADAATQPRAAASIAPPSPTNVSAPSAGASGRSRPRPSLLRETDRMTAHRRRAHRRRVSKQQPKKRVPKYVPTSALLTPPRDTSERLKRRHRNLMSQVKLRNRRSGVRISPGASKKPRTGTRVPGQADPRAGLVREISAP